MYIAADWLMPVVIVIFFILKAVFGKRETAEDGQPEPTSSSPPVEIDRSQEIQKEIRRRIAERKQQQQPQQASPPQRTPAQQQTQMHPQQQAGQTTFRPTTREPSDDGFHQARPEAHTRYEQFADSKAASAQVDLEAQLREQLQKMEETKAHAARIRKSKSWGKSSRSGQQHTPDIVGSLRDEVVNSLSDPRGPRKAFLYMEVLGAPVSARRENSFVQFWEQK